MAIIIGVFNNQRTPPIRGKDNENNLISIGGNGNSIYGGANGRNFIYSSGIGNVIGGQEKDDVIFSYGGPNLDYQQGNRLEGLSGNDILFSAGSGNVLFGHRDNDVLVSYGEKNLLFGGDGNDTLVSVGSQNELHGTGGNDTLVSVGSQNTLNGDNNNDTLLAIGNLNKLVGGSGDDLMIAVGNNNTLDGAVVNGFGIEVAAVGNGNRLDGGSSNDRLLASGDRNLARGNAGNDELVLTSGIGNVLYGGVGADTYSVGGDGPIFIESVETYNAIGESFFERPGNTIVIDLEDTNKKLLLQKDAEVEVVLGEGIDFGQVVNLFSDFEASVAGELDAVEEFVAAVNSLTTTGLDWLTPGNSESDNDTLLASLENLLETSMTDPLAAESQLLELVQMTESFGISNQIALIVAQFQSFPDTISIDSSLTGETTNFQVVINGDFQNL